MISARVTKDDLELISNLIFESYIEKEFEFQKTYITFRTLKLEERESIARRYKHASSHHNLDMILDVLSYSIIYVNGIGVPVENLRFSLSRLDSRVVFIFYKFYQELDESISRASRYIDYYLETKRSRTNWYVFKTCARLIDFFSLRKMNQFQFYWVVVNYHKDTLEEEKREWGRFEYMTNSVCAFVNPKAYQKSKNKMGIVEQLEQHEDKEKQVVAEQLERGEDEEQPEVTQEDDNVFSSMEKLHNETQEEYEARVNILIQKHLSGELVDDHDKMVREDEFLFFRKFLLEKKKKVLVERELYKRRGMRFESTILDNEASRRALEEDKKKGFFHDDISYLDVVCLKDFAAIPTKEKQRVFDDIMKEQINVEEEVDRFLKGLSGQVKRDVLEDLELGEGSSRVEVLDDDRVTSSDSRDVEEGMVKNAAEKAASMDISVDSVDLMKQQQEKTKKIESFLERRKRLLRGVIGKQNLAPKIQDENVDTITFEE